MKTIKWFMQEYRQEDAEGQYYMREILKIYYKGIQTGVVCMFGGFLITLLVYWVAK